MEKKKVLKESDLKNITGGTYINLKENDMCPICKKGHLRSEHHMAGRKVYYCLECENCHVQFEQA